MKRGTGVYVVVRTPSFYDLNIPLLLTSVGLTLKAVGDIAKKLCGL